MRFPEELLQQTPMSYAILWVVQGIMEKKMDPAPRHVKLSYGSRADANFSTHEFCQVTWCNKSCFQCQILMLHLMLKRQNPKNPKEKYPLNLTP